MSSIFVNPLLLDKGEKLISEFIFHPHLVQTSGMET